MRLLRFTLCALLTLLLTSAAHGKDLRGRFGVGVDTQMALSATAAPTALSVKYTLPAADKTINMQVQGLFALKITEQQPASMMAGARFLYPLVAEDNLNLFVGIGAAYLSGAAFDLALDDNGDPLDTFRVQPLMGLEFFFYGLENLGFTAGLGLNVDLLGAVQVATTGATFGALGIHYYF